MNTYYNDKKFYNHLEEWIGGVLLAIMLVMLFVQVVMRYVFHASCAWISEYALYMFMYFVFLACSGAFLRNDHIQIVAVIDRLPKKVKPFMHIFIMIVNIIFAADVMYFTIVRAIDQYQLNTVSITQFPMWIMTDSLAVGMGASIIRCTVNIYHLIRYDILHPGTKEAN